MPTAPPADSDQQWSEVTKGGATLQGAPTATTDSELESRNYNAGPTSLMPVWRLQTVEEQRELLAMEQAITAATDGQVKAEVKTEVKSEVHDLLGDEPLSAAPGESLRAEPILQFMTFGFPNPLAGRKGGDGQTVGQLVFNARSETVEEKAMWKTLLHKKRCVVMVDGFFEFHTETARSNEPPKKQPYFFHCKNAGDAGDQPPTIAVGKKGQAAESPFPIMHLAGVFDAAVDDATGELQYSFCILTCAPSKEMVRVHSRMPVVLSPEDARKWVDVEGHTFADVKHLLVPFEGLSFYKVPSVMNSGRNHGVECIEPLDQYEKRMKASGVARFFAPVAKTTSAPAAAASGLASAVSAAAADAEVDSFFNLTGSPGQLFPPASSSSHINPADPGQTTGDHRPATSLPSECTSDAAIKAECFVRQVKGEPMDECKASSSATSPSLPTMPLKRHHEPLESEAVKTEPLADHPPSPKRQKHNTNEG